MLFAFSIYEQMYTQNISIPPDYFTWRSAISSQNEAEHDWTEADELHGQEKTGKPTHGYYLTH